MGKLRCGVLGRTRDDTKLHKSQDRLVTDEILGMKKISRSKEERGRTEDIKRKETLFIH